MRRTKKFIKENYIVVFKIFVIWQTLLQWTLAPIFPRWGTFGNVLIVLGAVGICGLNYKSNKYLIQFKEKKWSYLFLGAVFLSIVFNFRINFVDNMEAYIFLLIEILILMSEYTEDMEKLKKDLYFFSNGVALLMFICSAIGFILYLFNVHLYLYSNRYCGIFSNPNQSSVMAFWGMLVSAIGLTFYKETRYKWQLIFHGMNILLNFFMFTLSNSNTGKVMMLIGVGFGSFALTFWKKKKMFLGKKIMLAILCGSICGGMTLAAYDITQNILAYAPGSFEIIEEKIQVLEDNIEDEEKNTGLQEIEKKNFDRSNQEGGLNNNRFEIWHEGMEIFKHSMIVGCGPRNVSDFINQYVKNPRSEIEAGGLHNMYLEILVTCGIIGMMTFLGMMISKAIPVWNYIFSKNRTIDSKNFRILLLCIGVVSFLAMNITESTLFFTTASYSLCFWCILGYLLNAVKLCKKNGRN